MSSAHWRGRKKNAPDRLRGSVESSCDFAAAYEQLRTAVLEGAPSCARFGFVILVREGLAAWMEHEAARPQHVPRTTPGNRPTMCIGRASDLYPEIVTLLANMATVLYEEVCA